MTAPALYLGGKVAVHAGDCRQVLAELADGSIDAVVTDPPYALVSISKRFGADGARPPRPGVYARGTAGFMGKRWDTGATAFDPAFWAEVLRVLKPGGHVAAFGGTRTYHRLVCAIEDAGFEIRDQIAWVCGSGFPKSRDVSKAIDKAAGAAREIIGERPIAYPDSPSGYTSFSSRSSAGDGAIWGAGSEQSAKGRPVTAPATDAARQWDGWGTALKPAFEPLCLGQKPYTNEQFASIIGSALFELWGRLWSMLSATDAVRFSALNPFGFGEAFVSAQWNADGASNTRAALCDRMGMSQFESALISSLSTVRLWNVVWAESLARASMFTIETEFATTIDLKTLKLCLLKITVGDIIEAHKSGQWSTADASIAAQYSNGVVMRLRGILEHSAAEHALSQVPISYLDETGPIEPNWESICLARRPLVGTVAANVLAHGVGALNIEACRVELDGDYKCKPNGRPSQTGLGDNYDPAKANKPDTVGRWPANLVHDGSAEVTAAFPETASGGNPQGASGRRPGGFGGVGSANGDCEPNGVIFADSGSAARFFYTAKADADERMGSRHPTVKPVDLMQWLCRLITPPGGVVLDPFAGTGTAGEAAWREGFRAVLVELDPESLADIDRRLEHVLSGPDERARAIVKARGELEGLEGLPLFDV